MTAVQGMLGSPGRNPAMKKSTICDQEEAILAGGSEIIESASLYDSPPNWFIAVRKSANLST